MATVTIEANGDYFLPVELLPEERGFELGGSVVGTGASVTVQLWGKIAGVKTNLDVAQTVTPSTPVVWPSAYSANKYRGVTVTGMVEGNVLTLEMQ
jgi:hypothetical protein